MLARIKAHLIEDYAKAYKLFSVQLAALLVFLEGAYAYQADFVSYLPENTRGYVAGAILVARIYKQTKAK